MTPTMKRILKSWLLAAALCFCVTAAAERPMLIHSHNDYCRRAPFWQAYAQGVYSIEADVFLHDGRLLVGHDVEDLSPDMTFESLYVEPIVTLFGRNGGRAWKDSDERLQLMVELKSATEPTLQAVTALLGRYPEVFDPAVNPEAVRIAVTGRVPAPEDFGKYPAYVRFDGNWETDYTPDQLERIALVSVNFRTYSQWNGKGSIIPVERVKLEKIIDRAHGWGKPVRFWGAPEGTTVYYTFYDMGIDYINTDRPEVCAGFFDDFGNKNFQIGQRRTSVGGVTGTKRLDKTTRDFRGFQNDKLQLTEGIDVYTPTYRNDGGRGKVKNVIYLIGDGMGLSQIVAAFYANKGLSTLQMKYMGLQQNNALDAFTTDSAAGGSALATGERHDNRHISMSSEGEPYPSLSDFFHDKGMPVGVLTLGNVADATPTAFYGHSVERDDAAEQANLTLLADATRASIAKLQEQGGKGFFLMVEGAKIDYAGHSRCLPGSIIEMLSFDLAVAEALKFADRNGETLVVVTADHETGGLVLVDGDERTGRVMGVYVSDDHTPAMLPVFAYGPGADKFCGTYMNTEIARRIKSLIK